MKNKEPLLTYQGKPLTYLEKVLLSLSIFCFIIVFCLSMHIDYLNDIPPETITDIIYVNDTRYETVTEYYRQEVFIDNCTNEIIIEQADTTYIQGLIRQLKYCEKNYIYNRTLSNCESELSNCNASLTKIREAIE